MQSRYPRAESRQKILPSILRILSFIAHQLASASKKWQIKAKRQSANYLMFWYLEQSGWETVGQTKPIFTIPSRIGCDRSDRTMKETCGATSAPIAYLPFAQELQSPANMSCPVGQLATAIPQSEHPSLGCQHPWVHSQ
jgi:hypothetical protein